MSQVPDTDLFFDFRGIKIAEYTINNQPVAESANIFNNHHVLIPSAMLHGEGMSNSVKIFFLNKYRTDGVGLHSFTDKVDAEQYIYTQFEADFCHYVFPCFDQPDLKATWKFQC